MPAKYVSVGDHAVHYLHTGATTLPGTPPALAEGQLFVFLHDGGCCAGLWQRQLRGLAPQHSAIAVDMPGHGRSNGVEGLASIDASVELLATIATALRLRPFVLVGHGLGATIALAFAAAHAPRLQGLVLAAPTLKADCSAALPTLRDITMGRLPQQFSPEVFSPQTTPDVMREYFTAYVTTDPRVRLADLTAAHGFDAGPLAARVAVRTLVVAGADDRVTAPADSQAVAAALPNARFATVADAGHVMALERAEAFNELLIGFATEAA